MKKAGLLDSAKRAVIRITDRGLQVLKKGPSKIDVKFLEQYPEFIEFRTRHDETPTPAGEAPPSSATPE